MSNFLSTIWKKISPARRKYAVITGIVLIFLIILKMIPPLETTKDYCTVLYDEEGQLLDATIASDEQWRFPPSGNLPEKYKTCLLLYEDRYFYYHPGINPVSLVRAMSTNIRNREVKSGASTLTMQLMRMHYPDAPRNYLQKIKEMVLALHADWSLSKNEILLQYASHAPFGGNIVGLDAACYLYFGRKPHDITWSEAALLAVLPNAPSLMHPGKNRNSLLNKRNRLLNELLKEEIIDSLTFQISLSEPLPGKPKALPNNGMHFTEFCKLRNHKNQLSSTLNYYLQQKAVNVVNKHYKRLSSNHIHNMAMLVIDIRTQQVKAYVGNTPAGNKHGFYVDMVQARRSSGSILKPLLYASMIDDGRLMPQQLLADIPTRYGQYSPENFNRDYAGAVHAHTALSLSLNIPFVRLLQQYGNAKFHNQLQHLGFSTFDMPTEHYGLSLILGGGEITLWEMATVYTKLMSQLQYPEKERYAQLQYIVPRGNNNPLPTHSKTIKNGSIYFMLQAMQNAERPDNETGWKFYSQSGEIAWKTGTSFGFKDAWCLGISPEYLIAVWAGNADGEGRALLTGHYAAAPAMFEMFYYLHPSGNFIKPLDDLKQVYTCAKTGYIASVHCSQKDSAMVPDASIKTGPCPCHQTIHIEATTGKRVNRACYDGVIKDTSWFVLPPGMAYYYRKQQPSYAGLPDWHPNCQGNQPDKTLEILYPQSGMRLAIPKGLQNSKTSVIARAVHQNDAETLYWYINQQFIDSTNWWHELELNLPSGNYKLTITDRMGRYDKSHFSIARTKH